MTEASLGHTCTCQMETHPLPKGKAVRDRVTVMTLFGDRYSMGQHLGGEEFK